jgi:hypothetical protein
MEATRLTDGDFAGGLVSFEGDLVGCREGDLDLLVGVKVGVIVGLQVGHGAVGKYVDKVYVGQ